VEDKNDTTGLHLNFALLDYNTVRSVSDYQHFGRNCCSRQAVKFKMFEQITNQMQQFSSSPSWRSFTAQHVLGIFPCIIRSSMTAVAVSGFTFISWWQSCCVRGWAATAVIELLMMGGKTPKTCWAVNERQDGEMKNCCIWLVICLNCTMMHVLTNLTFKMLLPTY
jgi:hypothetical protein